MSKIKVFFKNWATAYSELVNSDFLPVENWREHIIITQGKIHDSDLKHFAKQSFISCHTYTKSKLPRFIFIAYLRYKNKNFYNAIHYTLSPRYPGYVLEPDTDADDNEILEKIMGLLIIPDGNINPHTSPCMVEASTETEIPEESNAEDCGNNTGDNVEITKESQ